MKVVMLVLLTAMISATGCSQELTAEDMAFNPAKVFRDVEYTKPDDKPLRLDIYMAEDQSAPAPAVIWLQGGGWQGGGAVHAGKRGKV